jgi:hypothetical protein
MFRPNMLSFEALEPFLQFGNFRPRPVHHEWVVGCDRGDRPRCSDKVLLELCLRGKVLLELCLRALHHKAHLLLLLWRWTLLQQQKLFLRPEKLLFHLLQPYVHRQVGSLVGLLVSLCLAISVLSLPLRALLLPDWLRSACSCVYLEPPTRECGVVCIAVTLFVIWYRRQKR